MGFEIRQAGMDDTALLLRFIRELAIYEKAEQEVLATEAELRASLFAQDSPARAIICERQGIPVGFAVYFFNYSTWLARKGLYLEDLFVLPEHRNKGAGFAMFQHLARIAVASNCGRFEWNVLDWNTPAVGFYEALGARPLNEWVGYRLSGARLAALAERS